MLGAIKTLGTVLAAAEAAKFGKEVYDKYKDKKRKRQINEVHEFIGNLDLDALQDAINSGDTEALIDAVEAIMEAAEAVKVKSDLEELKDDVTATAKTVFNKVSSVADKVMARASKKFDELTEEDDEIRIPSFQDFIKGATLPIFTKDGDLEVTVNDENVSINVAKKTVTVEIEVNGKTKYKSIKLV